MGHCGELSPEGPAREARGSLEGCCSDAAALSCGALAVDNARCIAAAEGILGIDPVMLGGLCGLRS